MTTITRAVLVLALAATAACGGTTEETNARTRTSAATNTIDTTDRAATDTTTHPAPSSTTSTTGDAGSAPAGTPSETGQRTSSTAVAPSGAEAIAAVYAPPTGRYLYDVTGNVQTEDVTGTSEQSIPPTSTDDVRVSDEPAAMRMIVVTRDEGEDSTQEIVVAVTGEEARLVRLSRRPDTGVGISVNPDPPALLARMPYEVGDDWEIAWNDPTSGISGVGTGTVERSETVTTPAGTFDTVVVTVVQRLRGTISGTLTLTSWIDPTTGVQPRQHVVTDLRDATGASRTDTTRTLRRLPA